MSIVIKEIQVKLSVQKTTASTPVNEALIRKIKGLVLKEINAERIKNKTPRKER